MKHSLEESGREILYAQICAMTTCRVEAAGEGA